MTPDAPRPFDDLTPHAVLDALADVGLPGDGRLLQLNSYENRVFQVSLDDGRHAVAKFYRPGRWTNAQILEEHAFSNELAEAEVPVVAPWTLQQANDARQLRCVGTPPTLAVSESGLRLAVSPRRAGRAPEIDDPEVLEWIGRFIGRMHAVGARAGFVHRRTLDVDTLGWTPRAWLLSHGSVTDAERPRWEQVTDQALRTASRCIEAAGAIQPLRLHGDCHPGNVLWTPEGPHFVDLDDACNGPAVQDLWMLLPGDARSTRAQIETLLEGYETFRPFDRRELALIEPLRTLRMVHHSAWLAQRWADPAFPQAFPWFGNATYWSQQIGQLVHQTELMDETS